MGQRRGPNNVQPGAGCPESGGQILSKPPWSDGPSISCPKSLEVDDQCFGLWYVSVSQGAQYRPVRALRLRRSLETASWREPRPEG